MCMNEYISILTVEKRILFFSSVQCQNIFNDISTIQQQQRRRRHYYHNHHQQQNNTAISALVVALWVIAITFIQNPKYEAATSINDEGQEVIEYANLYFFSWLNFVAAVYLFGNVIRDNLAYNPKFSQWVLLFASSVVLLSTSVALHDDICAAASETVCGRLRYAVAVGSLGIIFSAIAILATMCGYMGKILEIGTSVLCSIFFFFGVGTYMCIYDS